MNLLKYLLLSLVFLGIGLGSGWLFGQIGAAASATTEARPIDRSAAGLPASDELIMISLSTCPVCIKARAWLDAQGIPHRELVVDQSPEAQRIAKRMDLRVVPVFVIGDQQISGFDRDVLTALIRQAAH
jgi:glutaredoxin 3